MKFITRATAMLWTLAPLLVIAQTPPTGPEGRISPNAPGASSPQPTTGRMNTVTGVDATDTRKNAATKKVARKPVARKPAGSDLPEASDRPNDRSRKDGKPG